MRLISRVLPSLVFVSGLGAVLAIGPAVLLEAQVAPPQAPPKAQAPPKPQAAVALPSARSVIDRHIEAVGGRKAILGHASSHAKGTISIGGSGMTGDLDIFGAKPNLMVVRIAIDGIGEVSEGFDGTHAWNVSPMTGPMLAQGKELEQKRFDSDFFGDLRENGRYQTMETVEKIAFDGRPCYKVKLVRSEGGEDFDYYDVATGLRAGSTATRETAMGSVTATQTLSDYRKFGDLLQPTTMKQNAMGVEQVFTFTLFEYDNVDPAVFQLPAAVKALIK